MQTISRLFPYFLREWKCSWWENLRLKKTSSFNLFRIVKGWLWCYNIRFFHIVWLYFAVEKSFGATLRQTSLKLRLLHCSRSIDEAIPKIKGVSIFYLLSRKVSFLSSAIVGVPHTGFLHTIPYVWSLVRSLQHINTMCSYVYCLGPAIILNETKQRKL